MLRADRGPQRVGVEPEVGRAQGDRSAYSSGHLDHRDVGVVVGLEHDDLVALVDQPEQRGRDALGAAGGDDDLAVGVEVEPVVPLLVPGDRLPQRGYADARGVLVVPALERLDRAGDHGRRAVDVREALAQVDRSVRTARADIWEKIVGGIPCRRRASMTRR